MKRMRVLHLVQNFPPEFRGGTEHYLAELVVLQKAAGLDVAIVCGSELRDDSVVARDEEWMGVPVRRIFRRNDERYGVEFLPRRALDEVRAVVEARAPDLVHLHHWFNLGDELLTLLAPRPAVATFHDAYSGCPRFFFLRPDGFFCGSDLPVPVERCVACVAPDDGAADLRARLEARRARFAREVGRIAVALSPSAFHADVIVRAGIVPAAKMRTIPFGLARTPRRETHVPAPGRLRLVTFGNLSRMKGVDLVLEALRAVAPSGAVELHLYGEPLAAESASLRAAASGLPVTWHGRFELDALAQDAARLDLALLPSRFHETFSFVVEEAIAVGLPVIVSDRGAPPRRIARQGASAPFGRAVSVEDSSALRATLSELMEHPERLAAMRSALPERPLLLADHEAALRAVYAEVLSAAGAPR